MALRSSWLTAGLVACFALAQGCASTSKTPPLTPAARARQLGPSSNDPELVGRWLLAEMTAPGGTSEGAQKARERLEKVGRTSMFGALAYALDEDVHGHPRNAALGYIDALKAARVSRDPLAASVAWYAASHLGQLASSVPDMWKQAREVIDAVVREPGSVGWRARGEAVELWLRAANEDGEQNLLERSTELYGCAQAARIAGPFGHGARADRHRPFEAERPGPWPASWAGEPGRPVAPHVLKTERSGCTFRADEAAPPGVYYVESFVDLDHDSELIVAVQGAFSVWVDDQLVLTRDLREWGVWPKFGVQLKLPAGRHRIVGKVADAETSVRILLPDGQPAGLKATTENGAAYSALPPKVQADPNLLMKYVAKGQARQPKDELEAYLAAYLAGVEGVFDVADVLLGPLVSDPANSAPVALATVAGVVEKDPVFPERDAHDLARSLHEKAVAKDKNLYLSKLWLMAERAEKGEGSTAEAIRDLRALDAEFHEVPDLLRVLSSLYARLGWKAERTRAAIDLAQRFPNDRAALEGAIDSLEETGRLNEADELRARLKKLFPDTEIELDRALRRRDYPAAIAELRRLQERRPDRKDLTDRIAGLLSRSGQQTDLVPLLERALRREPRNPRARLGLADARLARGDKDALRSMLASSIQLGVNADELRAAIEIVEGVTELEPFRLYGREVMKAFDASGAKMDGNAARILDYSALWIHPDGTARMLEHELIRIQSPEAINKHSEQHPPENALVLHCRVHKKDGRIYEPERVEGKPTLTMSHLEVGDTIETEYVFPTEDDGEGGVRYISPTWFFREAEVAYWRSEYVVIAPKDRPVVLEPRGAVPAPTIKDDGPLRTWRWRVDQSPAANVEPDSPPIQEFLPSVRVGWGVTLEDQLRRFKDAVSNEIPADPRVVAIAERIVSPLPASDIEGRARRLYRWVVTEVNNGRERDGRRAVIGREGNRTAAFLYLARALNLPVELAAVRDRLQPPDAGVIAAALAFENVVIRLDLDGQRASQGSKKDAPADPSKPAQRGALYLTVGDKHAPFGYLPAELQGQPAVRLIEGFPREVTTPSPNAFDGIVYEGTGHLQTDGSAELEIAQRFVGKLAIQLRGLLETMPEASLRGMVESRILARALPSARLQKLTVEDRDDLDKALTLRMKIEVSNFARRRGDMITVHAPMMMMISGLTSLESRQTPLLLPESTHTEVHLDIKLPEGAKIETGLDNGTLKDAERTYVTADTMSATTLGIHRTLDIPAGRVPTEEYAKFRAFTSQVDAATNREIAVRLPSRQ
ncbi:MAG: hypothetical protein U0165_01585 [Polyangiaceae bacterium]